MSVLHIVVSMKPVEGNFAQNAVEHGVAGLNIDGCRIGCGLGGNREGEATRDANYATSGSTNFAVKPGPRGGNLNGRWPANIVLCHTAECVRKGTKKVKGHKGYPNGPGGMWEKEYQQAHQDATGLTQTATKADNEPWPGHADADGMETVDDLVCHSDCLVELLDSQSGILKGTSKSYSYEDYDNSGMQDEYVGGHVKNKGRCIHIGDGSGGASRFFKCFEPEKDNMKGSDDA